MTEWEPSGRGGCGRGARDVTESARGATTPAGITGGRLVPYETFWESEGIRWVYTGAMSDDDVLRANLVLYDDPRFESIKYQIADFSGVDALAAHAETIRRLSHMDKDQSSRNPNLRVAVIAATPLTRGIASMYRLAAGATPWAIEVFETEEDARDWLAK